MQAGPPQLILFDGEAGRPSPGCAVRRWRPTSSYSDLLFMPICIFSSLHGPSLGSMRITDEDPSCLVPLPSGLHGGPWTLQPAAPELRDTVRGPSWAEFVQATVTFLLCLLGFTWLCKEPSSKVGTCVQELEHRGTLTEQMEHCAG